MPRVYTIDGAPLGAAKSCKTVRNTRTGCTVKVCKMPSGRWKFQKGTTHCPRR